MQTATSETESKSRDPSICVHHYTHGKVAYTHGLERKTRDPYSFVNDSLMNFKRTHCI